MTYICQGSSAHPIFSLHPAVADSLLTPPSRPHLSLYDDDDDDDGDDNEKEGRTNTTEPRHSIDYTRPCGSRLMPFLSSGFRTRG